MNLMEITTTDATVDGGGAVVWLVVMLVWAVLILIAGWKLYVKAGESGWVAIVPVLNTFGLLKIVKRPLWWFLMLLIPIVNVVVLVIVLSDLSKAFGRGVGMTLLLLFLTPIGYLVLGFGQAQYQLQKEPLFA
ncbi:hypothetical protein CSO01_15460 [Cellulomonas soli]|uniref:Signal peptidase I n=2 Tax=Cellulomonas soli TaxID=931535 RepID=A0A512PC95_9CELL|nr:hypothetical protein [Cellulomonas soli]GEP68831.1 hypothetical protein CSO01_15460 [Cellulomonas soli]